jgi:hypothetical protein
MFSVQYRRPLTIRRSPKLIPAAARASALKGEAQDPKGAITGAATLWSVAADEVEAPKIRPLRTRPPLAARDLNCALMM